ncbi:MAG: serine hydrolase domain-containing protein [Pseudomonadota bacterium]
MSRLSKHLCLILLCAVASTLIGCGRSRDSNTVERLRQSVDAGWSAYKDQHGIPSGGLAVYMDTPSGIYFVSSGMPAGVDRNTHFRVASNTKTFTAAAVMLLHQQGKLRIDDTIVSNIPGRTEPYVPNTAAYDIPNKGHITIRQLLGHTAGVFDVTNKDIPDTCAAPYAGKNYLDYIRRDLGDNDHQFTFDELVGVAANCHISEPFDPGAGYHYSNTGYSILGKIIERVAGISYQDFIVDNLVTPNTLSSTSVPVLSSDKTIPSSYVDGFVFDNGALLPWTLDNMSGNIAEGNIISTPADLSRWVRRLIDSKAGIDKSYIDMMTAMSDVSGSNYGLGIMYRSGLGYGHNGAHAGYLSLMMYDPADGVSIVLFFNVLDTNIGSQMALLWKVAEDAKKVLGYL